MPRATGVLCFTIALTLLANAIANAPLSSHAGRSATTVIHTNAYNITFSKTELDTEPQSVLSTTEKSVSPTTEKSVLPTTEKSVSLTTEKSVSPTTEKNVSPTTEKSVLNTTAKRDLNITARIFSATTVQNVSDAAVVKSETDTTSKSVLDTTVPSVDTTPKNANITDDDDAEYPEERDAGGRNPAGDLNIKLGCKNTFDGFGIHLGAISHLSKATPALIEEVTDKLYNDLYLRNFRTSYEQQFSPSDGIYDISCQDNFTCTWNLVHKIMMKYPDARYMASIWSPPHYMKNVVLGLNPDYEEKYYYFIKNITQLMKSTFNQTVELVSLVNEPENFVAPWDHCVMGPHQMCKMVETFKDPLISACPENSWFSTTILYMNYNLLDVSCRRACKIILTHAYQLNIDVTSPDFMKVSYDTIEKKSPFEQPIWQTEVSSTFGDAREDQMKESLRMAKNIIQFVGTTCVSRYYLWSAFTFDYSGESLIWGVTGENQTLNFPKKYFVYKHFTVAAHENPNSNAVRCDKTFSGRCLLFYNKNSSNTTAVFINANQISVSNKIFRNCVSLCCTAEMYDYSCGFEVEAIIPASAVCSCKTVMNNKAKVKDDVENVGELKE